MSKNWKVTISDTATYIINGRNKEDAIDLALDWFSERKPSIRLEEYIIENKESSDRSSAIDRNVETSDEPTANDFIKALNDIHDFVENNRAKILKAAMKETDNEILESLKGAEDND